MSVKTVKHINKDEKNRVEYLFVNFDCYDGNDFIAKLFCQEYQMVSDKKIDGRMMNQYRNWSKDLNL